MFPENKGREQYARFVDNAINLHVFRGKMKKEQEEGGEEKERKKERKNEREEKRRKGGREKKEKLGKRIRFRRETITTVINVITVLGKRGCSSVYRKEFSPRF